MYQIGEIGMKEFSFMSFVQSTEACFNRWHQDEMIPIKYFNRSCDNVPCVKDCSAIKAYYFTGFVISRSDQDSSRKPPRVLCPIVVMSFVGKKPTFLNSCFCGCVKGDCTFHTFFKMSFRQWGYFSAPCLRGQACRPVMTCYNSLMWVWVSILNDCSFRVSSAAFFRCHLFSLGLGHVTACFPGPLNTTCSRRVYLFIYLFMMCDDEIRPKIVHYALRSNIACGGA